MIRELIRSVTGYPGLFAICVVSGILVPLPEDFPLIYAGARIAGAELAWGPTLAVAMVGVWIRDVAAWGIGRTAGTWLLEGFGSRLLGRSRVDRAAAMVQRHGAKAVLGGRFLVGFRAPVFMVSGAMGVTLSEFALWDLLGLLVAVPLAVVLGYVFGEPIADIAFFLLQRARVVVLMAGMFGVIWLVWVVRGSTRDQDVPDVD